MLRGEDLQPKHVPQLMFIYCVIVIAQLGLTHAALMYAIKECFYK